MIIVLPSNTPNYQVVLSHVIKETNFWKLDLKSRVSFTALANLLPAKIKGQKSKLIRSHWWHLFLKKWLYSFLCCIFWDRSLLSSKSSLYYFLPVLDQCKCFLEINLIKESSSLIETLLKPGTTSLDDKMPLLINLIILLSNFL